VERNVSLQFLYAYWVVEATYFYSLKTGGAAANQWSTMGSRMLSSTLMSIMRRIRRFPFKRQLYFLYQRTKSGLLSRHESSLFGMFWYLLGPALMFGVLMLVFSQRLGTTIEHYFLYLLLGIILWNFFSAGTSRAIDALMSQASLIKSMPVRADILVLSSVLEAFVNHCFELVIFGAILAFYGVFSVTAFYFFLIVILEFIFVLGMSYFLSALFFIFRDLNQIWSVILRVWWFATPIFYQLTETGPGRKVNMFNPMFYVIDSARDALIYNYVPHITSMGILACFAFAALLCGYVLFRMLSPYFPEYV